MRVTALVSLVQWYIVSSTWAAGGDVNAHLALAEDPEASLLDHQQEEDKTRTDQKQESLLEVGRRQLDWIRSKPNGFVHEHFDLRPYNPEDPGSPLGVFAGADLAKGDLLFRVPRECLIATYDNDICDTVQALVTELELGNESRYEPYVSYLQRQAPGQLPTAWTAAGQGLLQSLLGEGALPPRDATAVDWGCHNAHDPPHVQHAAMLLIQRGWDELLIPIYDLLGHRNGEYWSNTNMAPGASVHDRSQPIEVFCARDIRQGEELYGSYDQCNDCGGRTDSYGTAEILRDYGFVEDYPQKWIFPKQRISFSLDYTYTKDSNGTVVEIHKDDLQLHWHSAPLKERHVPFVQQQVTRFIEFGQQTFSSQNKQHELGIPDLEWRLLVQYHAALLTALQKLVHVSSPESNNDNKKTHTSSPDHSHKDLPQMVVPNPRLELDHGQRQVDWVRSMGGFVNSKLDIRRANPNDPTSPYGVYATQEIAAHELLLSIPRDCLITNPNDDTCESVDILAHELYLGDHSRFEPYVTYLLETQPYAQVPALWSQPAKRLLLRIVLEGNMEDLDDDDLDDWMEEEDLRVDLPPRHLTDPGWIGCTKFDDASTPLLHRHAAMLSHQRGWDEVMIPVFDLMNHHNGRQFLNTQESHSIHDTSQDVEVETTRVIAAGEELYTTYDGCTDCGRRTFTYGTAELFRDYGFVEAMPQKWLFPQHKMRFTLDYKYERDGSVLDPNDLQLQWLGRDRPGPNAREFLEDHVERLQDLQATALSSLDLYPTLPQFEWDSIREYHGALLTALKTALQVLDQEEQAATGETCPDGSDSCQASVSNGRYHALDEMFDDEGYNSYVCKVDWSFPTYDRVAKWKSQYQKIFFVEDPQTHDVCFELDSTYQICGCYRPHYHEMGTHYPASFLPQLKRVLWVGGGDSMLLHEIIKYNPSLELAIGLELDQKVTRGSFKYFGTQPHWDRHDKVQWWYGDAAKSLLMLPKEWFGTFDLVLVDLSETVMSNSVTKELDIMAALSLLLKPDGIFMKNEIYFDHLHDLFKYSMHLHVYDVPVLCSQSFIFGSNSIDFMKQKLTNHGTKDNLVFKPIDELDNRYFEVHEYGMNPYPARHCTDEANEPEPQEQESSPGILMILEAENVAFKGLASINKVSKLVEKTLKKDGLTVVSSFTSESAATVVLEEGYVIARTWPENNYCAFDLHLWSSFAKMETIKNSLIEAMGSSGPQSSSAFRIVAGGMYGIGTWKSDSTSRGPKLPQCEKVEEGPQRTIPMDDSLVRSVVKESLELVMEENVVATVLCGPESSTGCSSIEVASQHAKVAKVVPLWTCDDIAGGVEFQQDSGTRKFACEKEMIKTLEDIASAKKNVGVVIVDPSTEYAMAQIMYKIASRGKYKKMFSDNLLVLAPILDSERDGWRRVFVDHFREIYHQMPLFRSEVLYNTTSSSLEMETFLAGDETFIQRVNDVTTAVEESTGLVGETRMFEGGRFRTVKNPNPKVFALPGDYDQSGPFEQWTTQQALAQQTVFQFEVSKVEGKESIQTILDSVLDKMAIKTNDAARGFMDIGDGCVVFSELKGGSVVVLWDGQANITVNLFQFQQGAGFFTKFADEFAKTSPFTKLMLRDEMPRGYGRVVNFSQDIGERLDPTWSLSVVKSVK